MTDRIIATITKNAREQVRITLGQFNGRDILNLRVWFQSDGGEWRPSNKGIACKVELLPQLAAALTEAERQARAGGLIA
jgi:hypothetical protein